jgi:hypothetical protein
MRRAVAALGIVLTLAWGPAAALLCIAQPKPVREAQSTHLVLVSHAHTASKSARQTKSTPNSKTQNDRIVQAVSESLDTAPSVHFEISALACAVVAAAPAINEPALRPVYYDVVRAVPVPQPGNVGSRAPPRA